MLYSRQGLFDGHTIRIR